MHAANIESPGQKLVKSKLFDQLIERNDILLD